MKKSLLLLLLLLLLLEAFKKNKREMWEVLYYLLSIFTMREYILFLISSLMQNEICIVWW